MRNIVVFLALCLLIMVAVSDAKKGKGKKEWKMKVHKKHIMKKKNGQYGINSPDKKYKHAHHGKDNGEGHQKWNKKDKLHKKGKHGKFSPRKNLQWLKAKDEECVPACTEVEVCITGPIDSKPLCVRRRDLKKSMKLFHKYQKKEMKAWRKFKKNKYQHANLDKQYPPTEEDKQYLTQVKEAFMENKGYDKFDKHGKHEQHEKHGKHVKHGKYWNHEEHDNHMARKKQEHLKAAGYDTDLTKHKPVKKTDEKACTVEELSQMRSRLSGWFHVLHGVDHLTQKAEGAEFSIKHFHKHSSVKKEMRKHLGDSCGCFKSSMWYFSVLDKDHSDSLSHSELSSMEPHSGEPCVQPYLTGCDSDRDGKLSSDEWCCCFSHVAPPCFKHLKNTKKSKDTPTYIPRCDKEGYYMREQCTDDKENKFRCWCVDANGTPLKDTEVVGRRAHCTINALLDLNTKHQKPINDDDI